MSIADTITDALRRRPGFREPLRRLLTSASIHRPDGQPDIVIFSARRSGSTWLMEMLGAAPGIRVVNEPFIPEMVKRAGLPTGLEEALPERLWKVVAIAADYEQAYRRYLLDERATRLRSAYNPFSPTFHLITHRRVLKIVYATAVADWITKHVPHIRPLYLFRHPIATALSMVRSANILRAEANLRHQAFREKYLTEDLERLSRQILREGTPLEKFVLEWCLDNLGPLHAVAEDPDRWLMVSYEELASKPEGTLEFLAERLEIAGISRSFSRTRVPSASTRPSRRRGLQEPASRSLIARWQGELEQARHDEAFDIVERFGIDLYATGKAFPRSRYLNLT